MNRNSVSRTLVIAACVGLLTACGGEDEDKRLIGSERTPEAQERQGSGDSVMSPQEDQGRQQASGQYDDAQRQDRSGQEIPNASAVEFKD